MYNCGDIIVYGTTGICRVESVGKADIQGAPEDKLYYKLVPIVRGGVIYTPTDTKVNIRPAVTREEAACTIGGIAALEPQDLTGYSVQQLGEIYAAAIASQRLAELAKLVISIHHRKLTPDKQRCRYGRVDVKYIKLAEELLLGELAVVSGSSYEEMRQLLEEQLHRR